MNAHEVNFDALVGPTHNYAGLALGNIASQQHGHSVSNPKAAALEGLAKMKLLADMGLKQGVLPPQERPSLAALRNLGFSGSDANVLESAHRTDPALLASCYSASSMWAANAATVSPSADTTDHRVHMTPANLVSQFHRSLETTATAAVLRAIFPESEHFVHHSPLPATSQFADEGAANHTRLAPSHDSPGIELFVYGRRAFDHSTPEPHKYPARQTYDASAAIARLHTLNPASTLFLQQHPVAIDAGVFHNDVICVGHQNVLLYHEMAFIDSDRSINLLRDMYRRQCDSELITIQAKQDRISLSDAVRSYLFNSQIVGLPDGSMSLIAPIECSQCDSARRFIDETIAGDNPIRSVHYVDLRQSMRNGGGPACLRLRVSLTDDQLSAIRQSVLLTPHLYSRLTDWVERNYRDHLSPDDLPDPQLLDESRRALDQLRQMLDLESAFRN